MFTCVVPIHVFPFSNLDQEMSYAGEDIFPLFSQSQTNAERIL
jgi:hypothetical protein